MWERYWNGRGSPWEYDAGPPANRRWASLFARTPNYRGFGLAVSGEEEFRWHFGPMYYRGRLGDRQVKVLVVGQEGAQDESLSHRSFTGGTGGRMQHLLAHLGIDRSYLFLNTFAYPIFGQYNGLLPVIAQHPASPIARHRNELFDYAATRNDLRLAIAVGDAAKDSLASWVESHGGTADPARLHLADASVVSPRLRIVGVKHPGGAVGGAAKSIIASFVAAVGQVHEWIADDPDWLPVDPGATRQPATADYRYTSDPIPFRDFPYGVPWRLGRGGTSSNRRDGQRAIQLFSELGKYNNDGHAVSYPDGVGGTPVGYAAPPGALAWEPAFREYDRGPGAAFARLLQGGAPGLPWPDFSAFGLRCAPSLGAGPVYRGRLERPSLILLADQQDHDDLFTMRALTGSAGQRLQAFLTAAGVTERYAILRVLPVDTLGDDQAKVAAAVDSAEVRALYAEAVRRARPQVVLFVGPLATRLRQHVVPPGLPTVVMRSARQSGAAASWRTALGELALLDYDRDIADPTFDDGSEREQIPRRDLPFGTLRWQATSGDRAGRARRDGATSFDYYKVSMPSWAAALAATPLSPAEVAGAELLRNL